jgi:hypothetical protein
MGYAKDTEERAWVQVKYNNLCEAMVEGCLLIFFFHMCAALSVI